jgi:hypothetical protein
VQTYAVRQGFQALVGDRGISFARCRRFWAVAIVDDFSRECLALVADTSLSGLRVTRELTAITFVEVSSTEEISLSVEARQPSMSKLGV